MKAGISIFMAGSISAIMMRPSASSRERNRSDSVLDESQAHVIAQAKGDVEVRDRHGKHSGCFVHGFTDEDIRIARERADSKKLRLSPADVLSRLTPRETG